MSIQVIREGRGLVVEAPTGIGKTYAFLIPAIEAALKNRQSNCFEYTKPSPSILIMASTSALVDQLFNRCELILGLQCMDNVEPIRDIKIDKLVANHPFTKGNYFAGVYRPPCAVQGFQFANEMLNFNNFQANATLHSAQSAN